MLILLELSNLYRKAVTAARDIHNTDVFIIFPDLSNVFNILIEYEALNFCPIGVHNDHG